MTYEVSYTAFTPQQKNVNQFPPVLIFLLCVANPGWNAQMIPKRFKTCVHNTIRGMTTHTRTHNTPSHIRMHTHAHAHTQRRISVGAVPKNDKRGVNHLRYSRAFRKGQTRDAYPRVDCSLETRRQKLFVEQHCCLYLSSIDTASFWCVLSPMHSRRPPPSSGACLCDRPGLLVPRVFFS